MQARYEGHRPWTASPQDYEDVLGPNRSGGIETYKSGNPNTGLRKDEGGAARPMPSNGNGNELSGGAAERVPVG
jgi:hypothetical protein